MDNQVLYSPDLFVAPPPPSPVRWDAARLALQEALHNALLLQWERAVGMSGRVFLANVFKHSQKHGLKLQSARSARHEVVFTLKPDDRAVRIEKLTLSKRGVKCFYVRGSEAIGSRWVTWKRVGALHRPVERDALSVA